MRILGFLRLACLFAFSLSAFAVDPGDLDPTFGGATPGRWDVPMAGYGAQVELQADGKILVMAISDQNRLLRFTANGQPDLSFGVNGMTTVSGPRFALQPDGKIVVVSTFTSTTFGDSFLVERYTADGVLDPSFNGTGSVVTSFGTRKDRAKDVIVQPDGKIVVVGEAGDDNGDPPLGLARYLPDGALDPSFGTEGKLMVPGAFYGRSYAYAPDPPNKLMALQPDGKLLVVIHARNLGSHGVLRLNTNGTLDRAFGRKGIGGRDGGAGDQVLLQPDGRLLLHNQGYLARYLANGRYDSTFTAYSASRTAALQSDGKILALKVDLQFTRYVGQDSEYQGAAILRRYDRNGAPDTTFQGGTISTPITPLTIFPSGSYSFLVTGGAMVVQPDRKIVVAAGARAPSLPADAPYDLVLLRYLNDPEFGVATQPATAVGATSAVLHGAVVTNGETNGTAVFEYGTSPSDLRFTSAPVAIAGSDPVPVQVTLTGLTEGTVYYYRLRANHFVPFAPQRGEILNFATITYQPPVVFSRPATGLTDTGATLNASVSPNGVPAQVRFEWGSTTSYGNQTVAIDLPGGTAAVPVSQTISGLTAGQTIHFRAVATSLAGTTTGADRTFIPSANAPVPEDDVVLVDGTVNVSVLANDTDPNNSALSLVSVDPEALPRSGTAQMVGNTIAYTPTAGMLEDEFGYVVQNATGQTAKGTVRAYRLSEIRGGYYGVLPGNGQLNLGLTATGGITARLTWQGKDYPVMARLNASGFVAVPIEGTPLTLNVQFDPTTRAIVAQVIDPGLGGTFEISVPRSGEADAEIDAVRGQLYTTTIDVPDAVTAPAEGPQATSGFAAYRGSGFAVVRIAKNRSARFIGEMPDREKFSAGSPVSRRTYALYSALYKVKDGALGSVSGQAALQSNFELRSTSLNWQREADSRDEIFPGRFNTPAFLNGDRYTPPGPGQLLQIGLELLSGAFSNANLNLLLGGLNPELTQKVKFVPGSVRVVGENPSAMKLRISVKTGTFSGSFTHNVSGETTKYGGVFITSPFQIREGRGSFRGVGAGGKVRIAKP